MATVATPSRAQVASAPVAGAEVLPVAARQYVSWSAIIGGALVATALSLLLIGFGSAVGLSVVSPWSSSTSEVQTVGIAAMIWVAIAHVYSIGVGGYLAGRLRPKASDAPRDEVRFRDGMNGVIVWALSVVSMVLVAAMAVSGAVGAVSSAGTAVASSPGISSAAQPIIDRSVDQLLRADAGAGTGAASASNAPPLTDAQRAEIVRVMGASVTSGSLAQEDRAYLAQLVSARTGLDQAAAATRVDEAVNKMIAQAKSATDTARTATSLAGFWMALVTLLAGIAAWWAATLGGQHRDEAVWSA